MKAVRLGRVDLYCCTISAFNDGELLIEMKTGARDRFIGVPKEVVDELIRLRESTPKIRAITPEYVNRAVSKEEKGWGATVHGKYNIPVRYYYKTRDQARIAEGTDQIGENGRIA